MLKKFSIITAASAALAVMVSAPAHATTIIFDQIGDGTPTLDGSNPADQDFEPAFDSFDVTMIDDFEANIPITLVGADAVFSANNVSNATQWNVGIFSSPTAASTSLIGDVAHAFVNPGDVTITTGFNTNGEVLVEIPIDLLLTDPGTYWLGIYPTLDFSPFGQSFVSLSSLADDTPDNSFFANPGNGFGLGTVANCTNNFGSPCNVAYRLEAVSQAVPEPASLLGLLGVGAIGATSLKRKQKQDK